MILPISPFLSLQRQTLPPILNLHHRPRVMPPPIREPKQDTEDHDAAKDQDAVIHILDLRIRTRGSHGKEGAEEGVQDGGHGDGDAEAAEPERAPGDRRGGRAEPLVQHHGCG